MLVFRKFLRMYKIDDPIAKTKISKFVIISRASVPFYFSNFQDSEIISAKS